MQTEIVQGLLSYEAAIAAGDDKYKDQETGSSRIVSPAIGITGVLLSPDQCQYIKPSQAKFELIEDTLISYDPILQKDENELWNFFVTRLGERPRVTLVVHGYHLESSRHAGNRSVHRGEHARHRQAGHRAVGSNETDFFMLIDVSKYVQPWKVLIADDGKNKPEKQSFREILKEYTESGNSFKQIVMHKGLDWDLETLKKAIINLIRSTGYTNSISVSVAIDPTRVEVHSSSPLSKVADNQCTRCLCVFTCLCLIACPIYYVTRKRIDRKIVAHYPVAIPESEFYNRNAALILNAVQYRSHNATWESP